jgi:hypothetical protein
VNADAFRRLALALPGAVEGAHMGHPDFRVGGKVFASLAPDGSWGMVKLTPAQQAERVAAAPDVFGVFAGAWGRAGCTKLLLRTARVPVARAALRDAWRHVAPGRFT